MTANTTETDQHLFNQGQHLQCSAGQQLEQEVEGAGKTLSVDLAYRNLVSLKTKLLEDLFTF